MKFICSMILIAGLWSNIASAQSSLGQNSAHGGSDGLIKEKVYHLFPCDDGSVSINRRWSPIAEKCFKKTDLLDYAVKAPDSAAVAMNSIALSVVNAYPRVFVSDENSDEALEAYLRSIPGTHLRRNSQRVVKFQQSQK